MRPSVFDVAEYLLQSHGPTEAMKLQKLVYYAQAWSLVWTAEPLFDDPVQAWVQGPVAPDLWRKHSGEHFVQHVEGNAANLSQVARLICTRVFDHYGRMHPFALSDLTHRERPWLDAREGLADNERGNRVITQDAMRSYYATQLPGDQPRPTIDLSDVELDMLREGEQEAAAGNLVDWEKLKFELRVQATR